jgi:hypothetical protein
MEYGQTIFDLMQTTISDLKEKYPEGWNKAALKHLGEAHQIERTNNSNAHVSTMSFATIVSLNGQAPSKTLSLEEAIRAFSI